MADARRRSGQDESAPAGASSPEASPPEAARAMRLPGRRLAFGDLPLLMGIVNVTPDSFSDGGLAIDPQRAVEQGLRLLDEGADIVDIGGESTRPGADPVPAETEAARVVPVIRALARQTDRPLSVDTSKAAVAARALEAGAVIVNDVSALADPAMAPLLAGCEAGAVLMHRLGEPRTMQIAPRYDNAPGEIRAWLAARLDAAEAAGIARDRLAADPGIGFGKRLEDNLALLGALESFHALGVPLLLGASRKSFLGALLGEPDPGRRLEGSLAAAARAAEAGVQILRVHEVAATRRFLAVWGALRRNAGAAAPAAP
jgi:dihydropteroate synthase